jgi:hypothetical protein
MFLSTYEFFFVNCVVELLFSRAVASPSQQKKEDYDDLKWQFFILVFPSVFLVFSI